MFKQIEYYAFFHDFILKASMSIPFWFIWTYKGLGEKFFYFLPEVYLKPTMWNCIGLFIILPMLLAIIVPKFVSVTQHNNN